MTKQIIISTFIEVLILIVITLILYVMGKYICSLFIWRGDESLYYFLKLIDNFAPVLIVGLCGISLSVILIRMCKKTFGYLSEVLSATKNIYNGKAEQIELPPQLKEVENQLNAIQLNVRENERKAKEAEQRKNDLIVYLAHDLKTPLTSVIGYLTLLKDEQQISDELRQKYLSISLEKAERLEDLINEFFEITRFNLTTLTLNISNINLTIMLEQIAFEFKPMFMEKNLTCEIYADKNIMLNCDADKIQRVFDNLFRNAINYSFENSKIEIHVNTHDNGMSIRFCNNGNTIMPEKLDRIFEQFYRLDTARTTKNGGAGLGLAISKQIVELHKGRIFAESYAEKIIFTIELPLL